MKILSSFQKRNHIVQYLNIVEEQAKIKKRATPNPHIPPTLHHSNLSLPDTAFWHLAGSLHILWDRPPTDPPLWRLAVGWYRL